MKIISDYQKDCLKKYKQEIGLPIVYTYLDGTPIRVLVPIETELNKVMIVGAYPSAKFSTIKKITNTPVADIDSSFSNETLSGKELNEVILDRIGVKRSDCWITNLVKVFLFKDGHVKRYKKLGKHDINENRSKFIVYANNSLCWLEREIEICNPYVIILLGMEVTKVFFGLTNSKAKEYLDGMNRKKEIKGLERNIICLPHPGILMKKTKRNPWPDRFKNEISLKAKSEIEKYLN